MGSILTGQIPNVYAGNQSPYSLIFVDELGDKYETLIRNEFYRVYPKLVATFNPNAPKIVKVKVDNSDPNKGGFYKFNEPDTIYLNMSKSLPDNKVPISQEMDQLNFRVFDHELAHLVQAYSPSTPIWIIEGMADYAMILLGDGMTDVSVPIHPEPKATFSSEIEKKKYKEAARFLIWAKNYKRSTIIEEINKYARQETVFKNFDQLWEEYFKHPVAIEKNPQCYAAGEKNCPDLTNGKGGSYSPLTKEPDGNNNAIVTKTTYLLKKPDVSDSITEVKAASAVQAICKTSGSPFLGDDSKIYHTWSYIKVGKMKGYIPAKYLTTKGFIPSCPKPSITPNTEIRHLVRSDSALYKKADQNSDILAYINKGTEVDIICVKPSKQDANGKQDNWYYVQVDKKKGYLSAESIKIIKGESYPGCKKNPVIPSELMKEEGKQGGGR